MLALMQYAHVAGIPTTPFGHLSRERMKPLMRMVSTPTYSSVLASRCDKVEQSRVCVSFVRNVLYQPVGLMGYEWLKFIQFLAA
jgi:hypothetical protein